MRARVRGATGKTWNRPRAGGISTGRIPGFGGGIGIARGITGMGATGVTGILGMGGGVITGARNTGGVATGGIITGCGATGLCIIGAGATGVGIGIGRAGGGGVRCCCCCGNAANASGDIHK